jgi:hypothetical protein
MIRDPRMPVKLLARIINPDDTPHSSVLTRIVSETPSLSSRMPLGICSSA